MPGSHAVCRSPWALEGLVAKGRAATLDLDRPAGGLAVPSAERLDHVLGLDLRMPTSATVKPADHWLRGDDVVAVYRPADPRRLEATAMWRQLSADPLAWELVVSAQTALVESDGSLAVTCEIATGEVLCGCPDGDAVNWSPLGGSSTSCPSGTTSVLIRRADDAVLVAVHPTDSRRIVLTHGDGRTRIACWLFSAAIEKGVLHRGRVVAAIGPKDATTWADELISRLAKSPLPLTT